MINYLKSILPRIQKHGKMLNDTAAFVDIPWAFMDNDGYKVTYIFRNNNELLVSKLGEVVTGKWEYISFLESIIIENDNKKRMYNQGYINDALMLLRKEGTDEIFPLCNLQLLPDLNIENYLENILLPKIEHGTDFSNDEIKHLQNGYLITISKRPNSKSPLDKGNAVKILNKNNEVDTTLADGSYRMEDKNEITTVNGIIQATYKWIEHKTFIGINFEIRHPYEYLDNGNVFRLVNEIKINMLCSNNLPENKWIKLSDGSQIKIQNSRIKGTISGIDIAFIVVIVLIAVLSLVAIIYDR